MYWTRWADNKGAAAVQIDKMIINTCSHLLDWCLELCMLHDAISYKNVIECQKGIKTKKTVR